MITLIYNLESTPLNTFTLDVLNTIKNDLKIPLKNNFIDRGLLLQILRQIMSITDFGESDIEDEILLFFTKQAAKLMDKNPKLNFVLLGSNYNIFLVFSQHIRNKHFNHEKIKVLVEEKTILFDETGKFTGDKESLHIFAQKLSSAKGKSIFSL